MRATGTTTMTRRTRTVATKLRSRGTTEATEATEAAKIAGTAKMTETMAGKKRPWWRRTTLRQSSTLPYV